RKFRGSHEDFDSFVIPAVPDVKQQKDTANTALELTKMGVPARKIKIVLNRVEDPDRPTAGFKALTQFLAKHPVATLNPGAHISENEVYQRLKGDGRSIAELASDETNYKALISKSSDKDERIALAEKLAVKRLASGVLSELDTCFKALDLA
ncbi:MAG: StbB family protein, partial [Casimicrobium sp.]